MDKNFYKNDNIALKEKKPLLECPMETNESIWEELKRYIQKYLQKICAKRGWDKDSYLEKHFLLSEEFGELTKAIRNKAGLYKEKGGRTQSDLDTQSNLSNLEEEFADVLSLLIELASIFEVDLEESFRKKWEINEQREWE